MEIFSFVNMSDIRFKLARHSGVISEMRHYVPRSILLKYYFSNVKPIVQYRILVYDELLLLYLNQF